MGLALDRALCQVLEIPFAGMLGHSQPSSSGNSIFGSTMSSNRRLKAARVGQLTEPQSPRLQEEPEDGGVPPFGEAATLADLEQQPQSQVIHRNDGDRDLGDGRRVHPGHRAGHDDLFLRRPAVALLQPRNLVAAVDGVSRSSTLSRAERVRLHIGLGQGEDILPVVEGGKLIGRFPVALDRLGLRARCRRVRSEPPGRVELPTCSLRGSYPLAVCRPRSHARF